MGCKMGLESVLTTHSKKFFLRWTVVRWTPCSDDARVATGEKVIVCVLFQEFSEPDEIGINTCLILQNMLDVTVTALAVQKKREHPNRVKGFVETVVPNYCDPTFASRFRMKRQTFQVKDYALILRDCVMIYMTLLFLFGVFLLWLSLLWYDIVIFTIIYSEE